jgi:uncharacterized protein (DUF952 family)
MAANGALAGVFASTLRKSPTARWTRLVLCGKPAREEFVAGDAVLSDTPPVIYKIVPQTLWRQAEQEGVFEGAFIDLQDGYIHFSTGKQAVETAARHFAGQADLLLIAVETAALGDALVFEPSRGGDLFPHLYAALPLSAVLWEKPLPLTPDGSHQFPEIER